VFTFVGLAMFTMGVVLIGGVSALLTGLVDRIRAFAGLNYFFMAVFLPLDFALIWWAHVLATRRLFNLWFWVYAAFAVALSSLIGSRANTLVVVLAGVILYHLLYRRIAFRRVLVLLAGGAVALFIFHLVVHEYIAAGKLLTISPNPTFNEVWGGFAGSLSKDFYQIQALTLVVDAVPNRIPYQYGSTYLPLLLAPIPSSIWAGKLAFLSSPGVLTLALWPESWLNVGTTLPPSLMGEMYMNFGAPGVGIGMAVFGAFYGCAYACLKRNARNPVVAILYAAFVALMIHYIRGEFSAPTILLLCLALPILTAAPLISARNPRSSVPRQA
jgi:oligosaccharide repeat unit polymerase